LNSPGLYTLVGEFTNYSTLRPERIAQMTSTGSLVTTYLTDGGFDADAFSVAIQPDGKAIAGGTFSSFKAVAAQNLARITTDGQLDTTFPLLP
ncbi:MAG: delta-60 repeat domain-containing protein, partial [Bdellovibrionales bacterium]|nr:delta-60 repeat domain-containing protein [Bdellovibrionales bacterium]